MGVFTCRDTVVDCKVRNRVVEANPDIAGVGVSFVISFRVGVGGYGVKDEERNGAPALR